MKFYCGETWEAEKERLSEWHNFFVLVPKTIGTEDGKYVCIWLETVERRGKYRNTVWASWWSWQYRRKKK